MFAEEELLFLVSRVVDVVMFKTHPTPCVSLKKLSFCFQLGFVSSRQSETSICAASVLKMQTAVVVVQ